VRDELCPIQTWLKDLDLRSVELTEAASLGIADVCADVGVLRQCIRDREESCSRAHNEVVFGGRGNAECLRAEMLNEPTLDQDGLIQRQLRKALM
jgi:hypothetical protein